MPLLNIAVVFKAVAKNPNVLSALSIEMVNSGIDTPRRICHFISQLSHESQGFTRTSENLNYSSEGLLKTFPKYFKNGLEKSYHRQPEKIANRVYANRMGNGPESSGDGWKYRGRGFIQLTGKDNYAFYSQLIFKDDRLVRNPDLALDISTSCKISCAFWNTRKCNSKADLDDVVGVTRLINGGLNGLEDRKRLLRIAKNSIGI